MKTLFTIAEASEMIKKGLPLLIAGDEAQLKQLPKGQWIAGTIPYFMSEEGGILTHDKVNVVQLPDYIRECKIKFYSASELPNIPKDYLPNGVSFIVIPGFSEAHQTFAKDCSTWPGLFDRPLTGWITGFDLKDLGKVSAKTFNGQTGELVENKALVMHVNLPANKVGKLNIINLFKQDNGDTICFENTGFEANEAIINGKKRNLAEYLIEKKINTQLPLVADYMGAMINVSFQNVDTATKKVAFYAPVFPGVEYKIATPVGDYEKEFNQELKKTNTQPVFTCNCILNYLYANLEGKKTGHITGPITFGEIAYMLLNQTMVYISFEDQ